MNSHWRILIDSESQTRTYLFFCPHKSQGLLIDPVDGCFERDQGIIKQLGIKKLSILETHLHADHITSAAKWTFLTSEILISKTSKVSEADKLLQEGDEIKVGNCFHFKIFETPGHTECSLSLYEETEGLLLSGDALFIDGCGRTDFQNGSPEVLYEIVHQKFFTLPDETLVLPGHDYQGRLWSTIGEEKRHNKRLKTTVTKEEFVKIMNQLNLDYPKKIDQALPANRKLGKVD